MPRKKSTTVKVPEPRQLPSGNWFIQLQLIDPITGKRTSKSITDPDPKVCRARAIAIKSGVVEEAKKKTVPTLETALKKYVAAKSNVLSVTTVRSYNSIIDNRFKNYMQKPINKIKWQQMINDEAKDLSPKTVKNNWSFVHAAIELETGESIKVTLPKRPKTEKLFLTYEDIPKFVAVVKTTDYATAALLALHGLRMSELAGLRWKDIDLKKNNIIVRGAVVYAGKDNYVYKETTKSTSSTRVVPIMIPELKALLQKKGKPDDYVVDPNGKRLYDAVNRLCKENNLPAVGVHGLRHSFASLCYHLDIPMKITQKLGGWSNPQTVSEIYTHLADQDIATQAEKISAFFNKK